MFFLFSGLCVNFCCGYIFIMPYMSSFKMQVYMSDTLVRSLLKKKKNIYIYFYLSETLW